MRDATANPYRGEVTVDLGNRTLVLRPTWDAMVKIEERIGEGLAMIATRLALKGYGVRDLTVFLEEAGGIKRDEVKSLFEAHGTSAFAKAINDLLLNAMRGGIETESAEKNALTPATEIPATD